MTVPERISANLELSDKELLEIGIAAVTVLKARSSKARDTVRNWDLVGIHVHLENMLAGKPRLWPKIDTAKYFTLKGAMEAVECAVGRRVEEREKKARQAEEAREREPEADQPEEPEETAESLHSALSHLAGLIRTGLGEASLSTMVARALLGESIDYWDLGLPVARDVTPPPSPITGVLLEDLDTWGSAAKGGWQCRSCKAKATGWGDDASPILHRHDCRLRLLRGRS